MSRIRVLQIVQNFNYGGMERLLADLIRRATPDRFECHVLCLGYFGRFAEGLEDAATLHLAGPLPRYTMLWPQPLIKQIAEIAPDVVHTHGGVWYKASLAARRAAVPRLIHTEHGRHVPDPWRHRVLDSLAARRTDVVVAVSDGLATVLEDRLAINPQRIRIVRNGVDTSVFRPHPDDGCLRREFGIAADAPILGSIGRLEPIKGYDIMIRAFAALRAEWSEGPPPVLVVAGDGSERARLTELALASGVAGSVHLLGWRDDVQQLQSAFTLFTLSSRSEGTSISLLETMAAGLCPVVTDVGGNRYVLGERLHHRLVTPEDPTALAVAWRAALTDQVRRRADANAARARVEDAYSVDAMVTEYQRLYSGAAA